MIKMACDVSVRLENMEVTKPDESCREHESEENIAEKNVYDGDAVPPSNRDKCEISDLPAPRTPDSASIGNSKANSAASNRVRSFHLKPCRDTI